MTVLTLIQDDREGESWQDPKHIANNDTRLILRRKLNGGNAMIESRAKNCHQNDGGLDGVRPCLRLTDLGSNCDCREAIPKHHGTMTSSYPIKGKNRNEFFLKKNPWLPQSPIKAS